ncbi:MAG: hypothetical protein ACI8ZM_001698 [Crocinitomix sp.]|jgi:hypothetical protein
MNKIILVILLSIVNTAYSQSIDTLRVYQNDTLVFNSTFSWNNYKCWHISPFRRLPPFSIHYEIINPKDSTYYFIYNEQEQLVKEGMYSSKCFEGETYGDFYKCKYYYYDDKGRLAKIHYREDGHRDKGEYYKRGKLKETKVYY